MKIQYPLHGESAPCVCFDDVLIDEDVYTVYSSFDKVLRVFDLLEDEEITEVVRVDTALEILLVDTESIPCQKDKSYMISALIEHFNSSRGMKEEENVDIKGNPLPAKKQAELYRINEDGELIYAAFMQAYGIDLIDQQGKLHWSKFNALFKGLPKETKFIEVCGYRGYEKPSKNDSGERQMLKLKELYALPERGGENHG